MVTFQAGHETSATALTWWCGLVARHPEVATRIHDEVDAVLQGREPTPDTLAQLPWLQASLKEAMRLYPPLPFCSLGAPAKMSKPGLGPSLKAV